MFFQLCLHRFPFQLWLTFLSIHFQAPAVDLQNYFVWINFSSSVCVKSLLLLWFLFFCFVSWWALYNSRTGSALWETIAEACWWGTQKNVKLKAFDILFSSVFFFFVHSIVELRWHEMAENVLWRFREGKFMKTVLLWKLNWFYPLK